jgi:hypothetical protein
VKSYIGAVVEHQVLTSVTAAVATAESEEAVAVQHTLFLDLVQA